MFASWYLTYMSENVLVNLSLPPTLFSPRTQRRRQIKIWIGIECHVDVSSDIKFNIMV